MAFGIGRASRAACRTRPRASSSAVEDAVEVVEQPAPDEHGHDGRDEIGKEDQAARQRAEEDVVVEQQRHRHADDDLQRQRADGPDDGVAERAPELARCEHRAVIVEPDPCALQRRRVDREEATDRSRRRADRRSPRRRSARVGAISSMPISAYCARQRESRGQSRRRRRRCRPFRRCTAVARAAAAASALHDRLELLRRVAEHGLGVLAVQHDALHHLGQHVAGDDVVRPWCSACAPGSRSPCCSRLAALTAIRSTSFGYFLMIGLSRYRPGSRRSSSAPAGRGRAPRGAA